MDFKAFATDWDFQHQTSSPYFHNSNGLAEKGVQIAKRLLEKTKLEKTDPMLALLALRNTPRDDILGSPAQRLMSRRMRSPLLSSAQQLRPIVIDPEKVQHRLSELRQQQKTSADHAAVPLLPLQPGTRVGMQTTKGYQQLGTVRSVADKSRSYIVQGDNGGVYCWNRRHLLKLPDAVRRENGATTPPSPQQQVPVSLARDPPEPRATTPPAATSRGTPPATAKQNPAPVINKQNAVITKAGRISRPVKRLDFLEPT